MDAHPRTPTEAPATTAATTATLGFELRSSAIEGTGAFAIRAFAAGEKVAEYVGERIDKTESLARQEAGNTFIFVIDDTTDIDGSVPYNPARFINHSCAPNCEAFVDAGRIEIFAKRAIAPGEELTFNYGFNLEEYRDYPCRCGTAQCIGYIVAEEFWEIVRRREETATDAAAQSPENSTPAPQ